jgi:hypothetical protein
MRYSKKRQLGLIVAVLLIGYFLIGATGLPTLFWISIKTGIDPNWQAIDRYVQQNLIGMSKTNVRTHLRDLFWGSIDIHEHSTALICLGPDSDEVRAGGLLYDLDYLICYQGDTVIAVKPVSP